MACARGEARERELLKRRRILFNRVAARERENGWSARTVEELCTRLRQVVLLGCGGHGLFGESATRSEVATRVYTRATSSCSAVLSTAPPARRRMDLAASKLHRRSAQQLLGNGQDSSPGDDDLKLARDWRAEGYFVEDRPGMITRAAATAEHVALTGKPPATSEQGW